MRILGPIRKFPLFVRYRSLKSKISGGGIWDFEKYENSQKIKMKKGNKKTARRKINNKNARPNLNTITKSEKEILSSI